MFFDKDCKEIKKPKTSDNVKDSYWIFDKEINTYYYETDTLNDAIEHLELSFAGNKYNL